MALPSLGRHRQGNICKRAKLTRNILYPHTGGDKTKCIIIKSMKPSTKIVTLITPSKVFNVGNIVEMYLIL